MKPVVWALVMLVAPVGAAAAAPDAGAVSYASLTEARAHAPPQPDYCKDSKSGCEATFYSDPAARGGGRTWRVGPWVGKPAVVCLDQATASREMDCGAADAFPTATMVRPVEPPR